MLEGLDVGLWVAAEPLSFVGLRIGIAHGDVVGADGKSAIRETFAFLGSG